MKTFILGIIFTLATGYTALTNFNLHIVNHDEKVYREKLIKIVKSMNETQDRINMKLGVK